MQIYTAAWVIASGINSSLLARLLVLLLSISGSSFRSKSFSAFFFFIEFIFIISLYSTSFRASALLCIIIRIDLYRYCSKYNISSYKFLLSILLIILYCLLFRVWRKPVLFILSSIKTHFSFLLLYSQLYTSWKILAVGFCCPEIFIQSAIFWKLCLNRAVLFV